MPRSHKMKDIADALDKASFNDVVLELYKQNRMSALEASEYITSKTGIHITSRAIQTKAKELGIIRSFSEAFKLAISKGRKDYSWSRKPIKSAEYRKGIHLKLRYNVFQRDNFRCVLCGKGPRNSDTVILVVDHKIPVVKGGTNDMTNLQTVCRECNHGKMLYEERK